MTTEKLSFEDKVKRIIDQRLRNPTTLPAEYRAWLPRFIEVQDISLPISQVTGAYLTGETVESLGGDVHGRVGMIRAGASPYEFIQVTFDQVYGEWVSNAFPVVTMLTNDSTTSSTTFTDINTGTSTIVPWQSVVDAGLKLQFRTFRLHGCPAANGTTSTVTLGFQPITDAGVTGTLVNSSTFQIDTTQSSEGEFTNWNDVDGGVSQDDYLLVKTRHKTSSGATSVTVYTSDAWMRFVSA